MFMDPEVESCGLSGPVRKNKKWPKNQLIQQYFIKKRKIE